MDQAQNVCLVLGYLKSPLEVPRIQLKMPQILICLAQVLWGNRRLTQNLPFPSTRVGKLFYGSIPYHPPLGCNLGPHGPPYLEIYFQLFYGVFRSYLQKSLSKANLGVLSGRSLNFMAFNYTSKAIKITDDGGYLRKKQVSKYLLGYLPR